MYEMKPLMKERMQTLLPNKDDFNAFESIIHTSPQNIIRCNTLKIAPNELLEKLTKKWTILQPWKEYPEILIVNQNLAPGELGNAIEHILGYYYIQELSSMLSVIALNPQPHEFILDLFASPGSKTTQIAAKMQNKGTLLANDLKINRIMILASNLERAGVSNTIVTKQDAITLCSKLAHTNYKFDRILLDTPCSGEGTLRSSLKTLQIWNLKVIKKLSNQQKKFIAFALKCLKKEGTIVYSTCTHTPEENEEVVEFALKNFPLKIESISLPITSRPGITSWQDKTFSQEVKRACRIYPHDNNTEGFFLARFTLTEEIQ